MLRGISIAGFRNFSNEPQWIQPLSRINIFIGTNNSGKSNILRYIQKVISPAILPGRNARIQLSGVDRPRNGQMSDEFHWKFKFNPSDIVQTGTTWHPNWTAALEAGGALNSGFLNVPMTLGDANQGRYYSGPIPTLTTTEQHEIQRAWANVASMSGGSFNSWWPDLINRFIQNSLFDLKPHFVPAFRQIPTKLEEFHSEFSKQSGDRHLVDELSELAHPSYDQQEKKLQFEKLRRFIGDIIDDPSVEIEIPNDRSTINVKSGGNFLPIEALGSGIHEVFMLASELIIRESSTILLEEPEVHLHPHLQRRLMKFISEETKSQYFITTHSASIIDTPGAAVFGVRSEDGTGNVRALLTSHEKFEACKELGFRASDLLQSNCVIWVEGPSDRIYLKNWLDANDKKMIEGIDYSIMFYGGKLLSRLTIEDESFDDYIGLLPINRHPAILIDSDKSSGNSLLRETKLRVISEMGNIGGFTWVTSGREIENYYSFDDRQSAIVSVHPQAGSRIGGRGPYDKPISFMSGSPSKERTADKIGVANYLTKHCQVDSRRIDFPTKIAELADYIRAANA